MQPTSLLYMKIVCLISVSHSHLAAYLTYKCIYSKFIYCNDVFIYTDTAIIAIEVRDPPGTPVREQGHRTQWIHVRWTYVGCTTHLSAHTVDQRHHWLSR